MPTIKAHIEKLTALKHRLAVWESLTQFLDENFISKDGRDAPKALKVTDCLVDTVPEETIESVFQAIGEGPISELSEQIRELESQEVTIISGGYNEARPKET